jgi:formylglycine-generating enzyme required for sulfatase activity
VSGSGANAGSASGAASGGDSSGGSLPVPGGTFYRTYDLDPGGIKTVAADGGPLNLADPATVSAFRLDKYLVTVGRFRSFRAAWQGGWHPAAASGKHTHLRGGTGLAATTGGFEAGWASADDANVAPTDVNLTCSPYATWTPAAGANEQLPINRVNWYEAYAFCIWDGGFLPSDAELEFAMAGGSEQREYPWGAADPGTNNQFAIYGCNYPAAGGKCTTFASVAPVGTALLGAGRWGQLDLAGDMFQWDLDVHFALANPCSDCANVLPGPFRTRRGGDYSVDMSTLLVAYNPFSEPGYRSDGTGFRCARSP